MWFSPFVDWWLEWSNPLARDRLSRNPADMDQRGSAAELLVDQGLWVKGFVGKTLWRHLDTQWHQEMLVAELSRPLHPSRGYLQPPFGLLQRRPSHFPLARCG